MVSEQYHIIYAPRVARELKEIKNYTFQLSQSMKIAENRVRMIVKGIEVLKLFPEAGFNADEKFGKKLNPGTETRGITLKKDYIVLYDINHQEKIVYIRYLLPTKSDYMKLFR